MEEIQVVVDHRTGTIRSIYRDAIRQFLIELGDPEIVRATDVEWDASGHVWVARLRNKKRTTIGSSFKRKYALEREVSYLERHILPTEKFNEIFDAQNKVEAKS